MKRFVPPPCALQIVSIPVKALLGDWKNQAEEGGRRGKENEDVILAEPRAEGGDKFCYILWSRWSFATRHSVSSHTFWNLSVIPRFSNECKTVTKTACVYIAQNQWHSYDNSEFAFVVWFGIVPIGKGLKAIIIDNFKESSLTNSRLI